MTDYSLDITHCNHNLSNLSLGEVPLFLDETEVVCKNVIFWQKIANISEMVQYRAKVTTMWI